MSKNKDALKFFQAYIYEMIDIGGINLPKSISVSLGAKLGKLLKKRGIFGLENSLRQIYAVLNAKTKIKIIDDNTKEVTLKYNSNFCPLGGKFNPGRAQIIQDTICIPYTKSMLKSLDLDTEYKIETTDCILKTNDKICQYRLKGKE
ncbi:MAG: hypothetical protein ACW986_17095 [Promethearchaeota archaeon]|jgi:hypothetical protein